MSIVTGRRPAAGIPEVLLDWSMSERERFERQRLLLSLRR